MLTTLCENPWYATCGGVLFAVGFFAGWIQTGIHKLLWGCVASIVFFGCFVLLEVLVETNREQIVATVVSIARAVERGDHEAAVKHIHPSMPVVRSRALAELRRYHISKISVKNNLVMQLHWNTDPLEASTGFNVVVRGSIARINVEDQSAPRYIHAQFVRDPDDHKWYIIAYGHDDIRTGLSHHARLRNGE